jgi:hypothetical protein
VKTRCNKEVVAMTEEDEFAKKFEDEFCLVSSFPQALYQLVCGLIDSGATCHMT